MADEHETFYSISEGEGHTPARPRAPRRAKEGYGSHTFANGSTYDGEWAGGMMHGKGTFVEAGSGDRFDGQWAAGRRVAGAYYFANGDVFLGAFDAATGNYKHGRGVVVDDHVLYDVVYDMDVLVSKTPFDPAVARPAHASPSHAPQGRAVHGSPHRESAAPQRMDALEAARLVLRERRLEVERSQRRQRPSAFAALQRADVERGGFITAPPKDLKDAFRFFSKGQK